MSDSSAEECCGTGGGYCDVEWTTTGQWLNMDDYGCHGTDFFRVSPGCSLTVATGNDNTGATYDYDSSVLVCGYDQCESRDTPGCDTVRSIYITGSSGPTPLPTASSILLNSLPRVLRARSYHVTYF